MSNTLEMIEKEALQLPEDQKVTLAHRMLASAEPPPDPSVDALWDAEILRRIEKLDSGRTTRHSAAEVFGELDRRLER
jgi:hypothetical protein